MSKVRVGLIGVSARGGWAGRAHIPALKALPDFAISALVGSTVAGGQDAARKFDIPHVCADHFDLVQRDDVDLVVVTVRVAAHRALVDAALNAGKAVLCEWPLGTSAAEADDMARRAAQAGTFHFVGLQARANPAVRYLRELVQEGYVGDILSATVVASGMAWGDDISERGIYTQAADSGATMLHIPFGHSIDALCWCIGEFTEVAGMTAVRQPDVRVKETGELVRKTAADQIGLVGRLQSRALVSIHFRGGQSSATNFLFEVKGSKGDLAIRSSGGQMQQAHDLQLWGARDGAPLAPMLAPSHLIAAPEAPQGEPYNIAHAYRWIGRAMQGEEGAYSTFSDALVRHRLLEAFQRAAAMGTAQRM